jgi:hypothetical protein
MQILHNEAEAYDDLLQEVFFHAIDRYDVSCHSSNGFNESHAVSAKHFVTISVRCCISTWSGCRRISNVDPSGLFEEESQREVSTLIDAPLGAVKRESNSVSKNSLMPSADCAIRSYEFNNVVRCDHCQVRR